MTTFALVHGAWHGAWCWELLEPELERRGHQSIAVELPCDDPAQTFESYAALVANTIDDTVSDDEVIVVGHSIAGFTIPLVSTRKPLKRLVYLCALVADPGRSFSDQVKDDPEMLNPAYLAGMGPLDEQSRRAWVHEETAHAILFGDCDQDVSRSAFQRLRPQAVSPYAIPHPQDALPDTPATYVVCQEDRIVNPDWSRRVAVPRLGADLVELPGSHSPFLSRPARLAEVLDELAFEPPAMSAR